MNLDKIIKPEKIEAITETGIEYAMVYIPKLVLALVVLIVGLFIIKKLAKGLEKALTLKEVDRSLSHFLANLISWALKALLIISVVSMIGVTTTSFVALIGAAGLALGLSLQGTLANFAGGVMIMLFRPYKSGDYIIAQGEEGTVRTVDVFATHLNTLDNRRVILPNGPLASGTIVNVTAEERRQVVLPIGVGYNDNVKAAIEALTKMCVETDSVLNTPEPFVGIKGYGDSSINLTIKAWVEKDDYWPSFYALNAKIKPALDKAGVSIPFPQRDVHIIDKK